MAESSTKTTAKGNQANVPEETATAPGLVPGDASAPTTKSDVKDASQHIDAYLDDVEGELSTLEDGIKQIRTAARALKTKREAGLLDELRNVISDVLHSVPLLRSGQPPVAHVEHRTLPGPPAQDFDANQNRGAIGDIEGIGEWAGSTH